MYLSIDDSPHSPPPPPTRIKRQRNQRNDHSRLLERAERSLCVQFLGELACFYTGLSVLVWVSVSLRLYASVVTPRYCRGSQAPGRALRGKLWVQSLANLRQRMSLHLHSWKARKMAAWWMAANTMWIVLLHFMDLAAEKDAQIKRWMD